MYLYENLIYSYIYALIIYVYKLCLCPQAQDFVLPHTPTSPPPPPPRYKFRI